jgi:hypothetical protein
VTVGSNVATGGAPRAVHVYVENPDHGQATSPTDLTVTQSPSIDHLDPARAATNTKFTLHVIGDNFSSDATLTNPDGQIALTNITVVNDHEIDATANTAGAHAGTHGIRVTNGDGGSDISGLTVFTKPTAPRNVVAKSRNKALLVTWTTPANNGGDSVTSYTATLKRHSNGQIVGTYTTASASEQSHRFSGLTNGVRYDASVVATNHAGNSPAGTASGRPKYPTKLTIARSDDSVRSGQSVTLSGRLTRTDGTALGSRKIAIYRVAFTVTKKIATVTTNARGKWSLTFKPTKTAKYFAKFVGDRVNNASTSATTKITVQS